MPIDPAGIIGQLKPVGSGPTPFEQYGQLLQFQGLKQQLADQKALADERAQTTKDNAAKEARAQAEFEKGKIEDAAVMRVWQSSNGDPDATLAGLPAAGVSPERVAALKTKLGEASDHYAQGGLSLLKLHETRSGVLQERLGGIEQLPTEQQAAAWKPMLDDLVKNQVITAEDAAQHPWAGPDTVAHYKAFLQTDAYLTKKALDKANLSKTQAEAAKLQSEAVAGPKLEPYPQMVNGVQRSLWKDERGNIYNEDKTPFQKPGQNAPMPNATVMQQQAMNVPAQTFNATRPDPTTANAVDPKLGYTPNAIYQNAITFALRNTIPAGSRSAASIPGQKAIQNKAAALTDAAGVNMADLQREYAGSTSATRDLMTRYQFSAASAQAANDNLSLAQDLSKTVDRTGTPVVNRYAQWATAQLGGKSLPGLSAFETAIYTAVREYAKVTSGAAGSVAGVTDAEVQKAESLLNAAQAPDQFDAVISVMRKDMGNYVAPLKTQIGQSNEVGPSLKRFMDFLGQGVTSPTDALGLGPPPKKRGS